MFLMFFFYLLFWEEYENLIFFLNILNELSFKKISIVYNKMGICESAKKEVKVNEKEPKKNK